MPLTHRRFTVDEYHRMAEAGILTEDDRVELLDGEIVEMSPIGPRHASIVARLAERFRDLVGNRAIVWVQLPIRLDRYAEPEPDLALVERREDFYADRHPAPGDVLLVAEVADTSLRYDREQKLPRYARAAIPEAWLVDLTSDRIERYREPRSGVYTDRQILGPGATLTALRLPSLVIEADEILGSSIGGI